MSPLPIAIPLFLSSVLCLLFAIVAWQKRHLPGGKPFTLFMVLVVLWALGGAFEALAELVPVKIFWSQVQYLGIVGVGVTWLIFALEYSRHEKWLTRRNLVLLSIIPLFTLGLVWTNEQHHLIWPTITPNPDTGGTVLIYGHGVGFWLFAAFNYVTLLAGTFLLIQALYRYPPSYRRQTIALVVGTLVPLVGNAIYLTGASPVPGLDLTPLGFAISAMIYGVIIFRLRLFDVVPVARVSLVENMEDGVLVLDVQNRIEDINPAAIHMLGISSNPLGQRWDTAMLFGKQVSLNGISPRESEFLNAPSTHTFLLTQTPPRYLEVNVSPVYDQGRLNGRLLILHDITTQKQTEQVLRQQNEYLAALQETTFGLISHLELKELLQAIITRAGALVGTGHGYVFLRDLETNAMEMRIGTGAYADFVGTRAQPGAGLAGTVWQTGEPIVVDDYRTWPQRLPDPRRDILRALVGLPLKSGAEVIGVLGVASLEEGRKFRIGEVEVLNRFAQLTSIALENARLFQETRQRVAELGALNNIGQALTAQPELGQLITLIGNQVHQIFSLPYAYIALYDPQANRIEFPYFLDDNRRITKSPILFGEGLASQIIRTREPLLINEVTEPRVTELSTPAAQSYLGVPILTGENVIGVIAVQGTTRDRSFTNADLRLLTTIAAQVGAGIQNAELYARVQEELAERKRVDTDRQRRLRETLLLNRVIATAAAEHDPKMALQLICEELARFLNLPQASAALLNDARTELAIIADYHPVNTPSALGEHIAVQNNPPTQFVLGQRTPLAISDVQTDARFEPIRALMKTRGVRSRLLVPLLVRDQVIGTLGFDSYAPREFSRDEIALVQNAAIAASQALENARLYEAVQQELAERKRAEAEVSASLLEKEILLKEIHHRVKNNLQIISSLLNLQAANVHDLEMLNILRESQGRVRSMALIHEKLYQSRDLARVDFEGYVRNLGSYLFRSYAANPETISFQININDVLLGIDRAIPCGLIINELVSNALKYAFPNGRAGQICVDLQPTDQTHLSLQVRDNGVGLPAQFDYRHTESLGLQLVNTLTHQLGGTIELRQNNGTNFNITFPN